MGDGLGEQVANNIRMTSEGETTVLKFKAGDRVRMPVTVMETDPHDREFPYRVEGPGGTRWWAKAGDVEAAEVNEAEPLAEWEKELLKAEQRAAVQAEVAGMDDDDLSYEYDYVSDLVLQWQALDAHIDNYLMRLNELTAEMNRRDSRDSVLTALSYVPIEKIMALVTDQELDLGNGLVVTRK